MADEEQKIETKFWKALKSDRTVMLALTDVEDGASQPMTAQLDTDMNGDESGPIYIFSSKETDFVRDLGTGGGSQIHFSSKGHDLFACVEGELFPDNDGETIDRLWNPFVAAWFEGGKTDPKLQLLRFEPGHAQIWLNETSLLAGVKVMLGRDPKKDYKGKTAEVELS